MKMTSDTWHIEDFPWLHSDVYTWLDEWCDPIQSGVTVSMTGIGMTAMTMVGLATEIEMMRSSVVEICTNDATMSQAVKMVTTTYVWTCRWLPVGVMNER